MQTHDHETYTAWRAVTKDHDPMKLRSSGTANIYAAVDKPTLDLPDGPPVAFVAFQAGEHGSGQVNVHLTAADIDRFIAVLGAARNRLNEQRELHETEGPLYLRPNYLGLTKEPATKETHAEHSARVKNATPCEARHMTFGNRCLSCGWEGGPE
jgi:hypothetical protein